MIQNGESLAHWPIRDQLGHTSIKTTVDIYSHLVPGANREAVNRLPSLGVNSVGQIRNWATTEAKSELKGDFKNHFQVAEK